MPQTIAKVHISFGLVSIPVTVFSATEQHAVPLHQVHARDGARIRMRRFCEAEGVEVPYHEVVRGYEAPDGRTVILTKDDLADLPLPTTKSIEVLAFVAATDIDPLAYDKPYYLGADGSAAGRPYVLLRDALAESGQVAICRVAIRTRESLAVLQVRDDVLVLHTLLWPDEIRPTAGIAPAAPEPRRQELQMARSLMQVISEDFRLEEQRDEYRHALEKVVEAKLAGVEPPHAPGAQVLPAGVVDLMAALQASVDEAQRSRHPDEAPPAPAQGKTGRKTAGQPTGAQKKAAAKKTARKRSVG